MRNLFGLAGVLALGCPSWVMGAPMPILPDLPPLPTHYLSQGGGFYAGVLTGYAVGVEGGMGAKVVVGNTFSASDLLLGVEGAGFASIAGDAAIEGSVRAGGQLRDGLAAFVAVGLGYSAHTGAFASVGASLEMDIGNDWRVRADYRYNHDLSGDAAQHQVLTGLIRQF